MTTLFCIRPKGFNIGNDAISLGLEHFIHKAFGRVVNIVTLPATSRYESHGKAGLTPTTIHEINRYGHGVIVGGGNLYENGELDVNVNALATLEPPLMLVSLGAGRIYNRSRKLVMRTDAMAPSIIKALHERANYSLARDTKTTEYLHSIGATRTITGGCPTVYLDKIGQRLPATAAPDKDGVLLSIRTPNLINIPLELQSRVRDDILGIVDLCRERGLATPRVLCHDHRDIAFAASFRELEYIYTGDIYTYLAMLRDCSLNITYRLHSALPCMSFGTPMINVSYDERALSLMDTLGFGAWNINMVEEDDVVGKIANRLNRLSELESIREAAQPTWNRYYGIAEDTFSRFAQDVLHYQGEP